MTRVEPKMDFDFERIVSALLTSQGNWHALKTRIDLTISELVFACREELEEYDKKKEISWYNKKVRSLIILLSGGRLFCNKLVSYPICFPRAVEIQRRGQGNGFLYRGNWRIFYMGWVDSCCCRSREGSTLSGER